MLTAGLETARRLGTNWAGLGLRLETARRLEINWASLGLELDS